MGTLISQCTRCRQLVSLDTHDSGPSGFRCSFCGTRQQQYIFPAYLGRVEPPHTPNTMEDGASCFFHEGSSAATICDDCGRYLCTLCTLPIPMPASEPPGFPERVCPACFENRVHEEEREQQWDLFKTRYPRHDVWAGFLIIFPVILFPLVMLSAITFPVAIYIVFRHWKDCRTPVRDFRGRMLVILALAATGVTVWLAMIGLTAAEYL